MKHLQNLHTHSTYDDGKHTPEETVKIAIEKGFEAIGFSGHSYTFFAPGASMKPEATEAYKNEIAILKEKYRDKINVYCGLECDMYSEIDLSGYDYLIGSVHFLKMGDKYAAFDKKEVSFVQDIIDTFFDGNGMLFAKEYYKTLAKLPEYGDFDIIGHFDVVTKHIENANLFDVNSSEYLGYAIEAAERLKGKIPYFEVNTGAMPRKYRTSPYPSKTILKELKHLGFGAVITSDCHDSECLDYYFDEAEKLLSECGFSEKYILTKDGFVPVKLRG